jgi:hypothetical protein
MSMGAFCGTSRTILKKTHFVLKENMGFLSAITGLPTFSVLMAHRITCQHTHDIAGQSLYQTGTEHLFSLLGCEWA